MQCISHEPIKKASAFGADYSMKVAVNVSSEENMIQMDFG
jgi:hypothetical protein